MSKKEQILQMIKMVVDKNAPDSEVYLYGSQARGNAKKLSDWDLLILLNSANVSFDFETKFMDEFYELELKTGEIFSPLIYSKKVSRCSVVSPRPQSNRSTIYQVEI